MTEVTTQEDWDPGRRRDLARSRTDRRRIGWREFRRSYPGLIATMAIAVIVFLAVDGLLISRYLRYQKETRDLRAAMSDVERKKTDEILAQNENRLKVMVELFKRQAKVDPTLHLSVSLDSGVMYLQREGALLREMPITVGPERRVGTAPDTVHIAAPRGKRTVEQVLGEDDVWDVPAWVYTDRGLPPGDARLKGALGPVAVRLDGGTVIYSMPSVGPLNDSSYVLPGAIRVRANDLRAIVPNLRPGVAVYFY
jgi:predicted HTH domain antitoxin